MTPYLAVGIAEGFEEPESQEQYIDAWQYLVDSGLAWKLQGWFGRTASQMIEDGILTHKPAPKLMAQFNQLSDLGDARW